MQQTPLLASQSNSPFQDNSESLILFETAPTATSSAPATAFLHQRTPASTFLHQQISAGTSSTPATTSPEPVTTFLHQQTPATNSSGPANTFLHQQIPVLNQRPPIQRIPVLYQLSKPAPAIRSCSNDHHLAAAIVRRTLFRFTIRHNKIWPFEENPFFVILA